MNTHVKYEIAKLLKEKGFDEPCLRYYSNLNLFTDKYKDWNNHTIGNTSMHKRNANYYSAPTIAEVVMWLYEKHGIWITVEPFLRREKNELVYFYKIFGSDGYLNTISRLSMGHSSPTEAYEVAVEYVLKNLI